MSLATIIYLIAVGSSLGQFMAVSGVTALLVSLFCMICAWEESHEGTVKLSIKVASVSVLAIFLSLLIPNEKTMYTMLAASGVQQVAESDAVGRLAPKSLALLEKYMDSQLKELENE